MNGDRFHTPSYELFSDGRKAPKRSFSNNLAGWIITQSKVFSRKDIEKICKYIQVYVCLVLASQPIFNILGNAGSVVDSQKIFESAFNALVNKDYSIPIDIEN